MITLRKMSVDDLPILFEHQNDPVVRAAGVIPFREREDYLAHCRRVIADDTVVTQSIWLDDQLVGNMVSFDHDGLREVGYVIDRQHWGKGIASEALRLLLQIEPRRPLSARVSKHNLASLRVLQKNGFLITSEHSYEEPDGRRFAEYLLTLTTETQ